MCGAAVMNEDEVFTTWLTIFLVIAASNVLAVLLYLCYKGSVWLYIHRP